MKRILIALLFVLLPLSGCLGGGGPLTVQAGIFTIPALQRGDPAPVHADDCMDLLETLNERARVQALVELAQSVEEQGRYYWAVDDVAVAESAADGDTAGGQGAAPASGSAKDADVTGTNNQEAGADEADVLKTDGEWTYVLRGDQIHILFSEDIGDMEAYHTIDIGGYGGQMLLSKGDPDDASDDRLVVITRDSIEHEQSSKSSSGVSADVAESSFYYGGSMTHVIVYDLHDRSAPRIDFEQWIEGDNIGARMVAGHAYIVAYEYRDDLDLVRWADPDEAFLQQRGLTWQAYWELDEDRQYALRAEVARQAAKANDAKLAQATLSDHLPRIYDGQTDPIVWTDAMCRNFVMNTDDTSRGVSSILSIDVAGDLDHQYLQSVGGRPILYGAPGALVLAAASNDFWWFWAQPDLEEATNLHWFDLDGLDVTHRASGRIAGIVQDQFGIDVHGDQLRVATTVGTWGRWWVQDPDPMSTQLVTLENVGKQLLTTGFVGGIAPEERLWSARFTDDRAYLVTFEQIDPLWVIDLTGPAPVILGELHIPGVSTYIHPIDDGTLLTVGYAPGEDGTGLDWSSVYIQVFDVTDPTDPRQTATLDVSPGDGWSWSGALHEHKAFNYWPAIGKLAIPVTTNSYSEWEDENGEYHYESQHHAGLKLIDVWRTGLREYGEVDQDILFDDDQGHYWGGIERSYFLGFPDTGEVSVYAMSGQGMTAHDISTLELQSHVAFENAQYPYYY